MNSSDLSFETPQFKPKGCVKGLSNSNFGNDIFEEDVETKSHFLSGICESSNGSRPLEQFSQSCGNVEWVWIPSVDTCASTTECYLLLKTLNGVTEISDLQGYLAHLTRVGRAQLGGVAGFHLNPWAASGLGLLCCAEVDREPHRTELLEVQGLASC